jgi:hypothetical protein
MANSFGDVLWTTNELHKDEDAITGGAAIALILETIHA